MEIKLLPLNSSRSLGVTDVQKRDLYVPDLESEH